MQAPRLHRQSSGSASTAQATNGAPQLRPRERPQIPAPPSAEPKPQGGSRRLLQPLPLAGIVLVFISLLLFWGVYSASTKRTPVLIATHALVAGTVLSSSDLRTAELAGDSSVISSIVPERELSQTVGRRLTTALPAGAPLSSGALSTQSPQTSAMTLAVPQYDVTGASLQAGDSVTVLATFGAGGGQASTRAVARALQVIAVGEASPNADPSTATIPVTVSVTNPSLASSLALANEDAKLDVLLEGSKASTAPIPQANQAGSP